MAPPLSVIAGVVKSHLPSLTSGATPTTSIQFLASSGDKDNTTVLIEATSNPMKLGYFDASIKVNNYCYDVDGEEHRLSFSIYARQCMNKKMINKNAPKLEFYLNSINRKDSGVNKLLYERIASLEKTLALAFLDAWERVVDY